MTLWSEFMISAEMTDLEKTCWVLEGAGFEEPEPMVGRRTERGDCSSCWTLATQMARRDARELLSWAVKRKALRNGQWT